MTAFIAEVTDSLPATDHSLSVILSHQTENEFCSQLITFCSSTWPDKHRLPVSLWPYWGDRGVLSVNRNCLLLYGQRIVIPATLRTQMLEQLHTGHQGIVNCRKRAKFAVWWPGLSKQLAEIVRSCSTCARTQSQPAKPLIPSQLPTLPWQRVAADFSNTNLRHTCLW